LQKYDAITKQEISKANLKRHVRPHHSAYTHQTATHHHIFFALIILFKQEKQKRIRAEVKAVWTEVNRLKEIATMKAEVRAARDNKAQTTA